MKDYLKPRTFFAGMMYLTFCFLAIKGTISEQAVIAVVSVLMGAYFGERSKKTDKMLDKT